MDLIHSSGNLLRVSELVRMSILGQRFVSTVQRFAFVARAIWVRVSAKGSDGAVYVGPTGVRMR